MQASSRGNMLDLHSILLAAVALLAARYVPIVAGWVRAWAILRRMPGPPGELMGQLKHFNSAGAGQHKTLCQWARQYGGIFRVRLANVNVRLSPHPAVCLLLLSPDVSVLAGRLL